MVKKYYNNILCLFTFLLLVYFIFYSPLHEKPRDLFVKSMWWFIIGGFCFYGLIAAVIILIK